MMQTYILKTSKNEYYCGKSIQLEKRLMHHKEGNGWFSMNNRNEFAVVSVYNGDFEKQIKRAGIKFIIDLMSAS